MTNTFPGGGQGLKIGLSHLDAFAHIGVFSAGGFEGSPDDFRKMNNGVMADADAFNRRVHLLWFGVGTAEPPDLFAGVKRLHKVLEQTGIKSVYYESPGTAHEWLTWRRCLHEFAPLRFAIRGPRRARRGMVTARHQIRCSPGPRSVDTRRTPNPRKPRSGQSPIEKAGADRANLVGFLHQLLPFRLKFLLRQKSVFSQVIQLHQVFVKHIGFGS
jgi:hypothetical protein